MDYAALEAQVLRLVGTGDYLEAMGRIQRFKAQAAGTDLGLCLGLLGQLKRQLSPANTLEALRLCEQALAHLENFPLGRLQALADVLDLCADVGDAARGMVWAEEFGMVVAYVDGEPAALPLAGRGHMAIARLLLQAGRPEEAVTFYNHAVEVWAALADRDENALEEVRARLGLVEAYLQLGRYFEAECEARVLLPADLPQRLKAEVHVYLGTLSMRTGRFAESVGWLEQAAATMAGSNPAVTARWMLARSDLETLRGRPGLARGYRRLAAKVAVDARLDRLLHELGQGANRGEVR